ncbi:hypothetical protein [Gloeothece verrucosa]|uniref:Uncharacterized protein n=1 Tax=Gloeothece verrucosa (strain PCC 7822) TaxID=497965 RepID=E0UEW7_GLOV7|nr:hypothetical protein [Gloeothece verrucosa]ADN13097.1 conserved hypothetical protein [Gloeothece verrucosa PCC 7822]
MKKALQLIAIAVLVGTVATFNEKTRANTYQIPTIKQNASTNALIPVALPTLADISLKDSSSLSGQVSAFDPTNQTVQISRSGNSRTLQISQIQKITFRRDALVYDGDGKIVIRGEDRATAFLSTWQGIPFNGLRLINPNLGQAQVSLAGVMKPIQIREISSVAKKSIYVVNEIQFDSTGKMNIQVIPTDPKNNIRG